MAHPNRPRFRGGASPHFAQNPRVNLLVKPGHADDQRGSDLHHVLLNLGEVLCKADLGPDTDRKVIPRRSFQAVREGEEAEELIIMVENIAEIVQNLIDIGHEVAVAQHHALGRAGGAGGINDRSHVLRANLLEPAVELLLHVLPTALVHGLGQGDDALGPVRHLVEDHDGVQIRKPVADLHHLIHVLPRPHEADPGVGVLQDILGLLRGVRGIDGHVRRTDGQDRLINDPPLPAIGREQGHVLPRLDPLGHEIGAHSTNHPVHLVPGDVLVGPPILFVGHAGPVSISGYLFLENGCHGVLAIRSQISTSGSTFMSFFPYSY